MAAPTTSPGLVTRPTAPFRASALQGAVLEVADLDATRTFYEHIFQHASGVWKRERAFAGRFTLSPAHTPQPSPPPSIGEGLSSRSGTRSLAYETAGQAITFVLRGRPRTFRDSGSHHAYRVPADRTGSIAEELAAAGHAVEWWHEDHPAEREVAPYITDPSGNRVQLVPGGNGGPLLDHVVFEVHDLEHAELYYIKALGGEVTFVSGWNIDDYRGLEPWMAGDDPAAPWTRRVNVSYRTHEPEPLPVPQVYVSFGQSRVGLFLASAHRQEPPPWQISGTPRVVVQTDHSADEVAAYLERAVVSPIALKYPGGRATFQRAGNRLFLRDPAGYFAELACA